jgi:hypothetical protein
MAKAKPNVEDTEDAEDRKSKGKRQELKADL